MFFNFEIAYKCSVYGNNSKSYIKFKLNIRVVSYIISKEDLSNVYRTITDYRNNKIVPKPLLV